MEQKILEYVTKVYDLKIDGIAPITIDKVAIRIIDSRAEMFLPSSFTGDGFSSWKKRKGGIFYKDLSAFLRGKLSGKYIKAEGENIELILRIIEDDELSYFESRRLVHGKISNKNIMVLLNILEKEDDNLNSEYIESDNEKYSLCNDISYIPLHKDEEESNSPRSLSIF